MNIEFQDRIDAYLLNRMSAEERVAFEKEIADDEELREQLSFTEDFVQVLKDRDEKLAKMRRWEREYERKAESNVAATSEYAATGSGYEHAQHIPKVIPVAAQRSSWGRKIFYCISGIAAVFIVGFFLLRNFYVVGTPGTGVPRPDNHAILYAPAELGDAAVRSESSENALKYLLGEERFDEAMRVIEGKMHDLMAESSIIEHDSTIDEAQREYGMLRVKQKLDELKLLKARALIGLHRPAEASHLLNELRSVEGAYQMAADSLYNQTIKLYK